MNGLDWRARYRAPAISEIVWASARPERLGVVSSESGSDQAWAWDLASGSRAQVSLGGVGAEEVHILSDGSGIVWWLDVSGDERGHWMVTPFEGGEPGPLFPDLPDGWMSGISIQPSGIAIGLATDDDYRVFVSEGGPARELYRHPNPAGVGREYPQGAGGLSPDGSLLCVRHSEHGDLSHMALRLLDARTGETVADIADEGRTLSAGAWSPDGSRFGFEQETSGIERPGMWDRATGSRRDFSLEDLPGPITVLGWSPAGAMLLRHEHAGRMQLVELEVSDGSFETVLDVAGTITQADYRPDGVLWYGVESSVDPTSFRGLDGDEVVALPFDRAAEGRRFQPIEWKNPNGDVIHGFLVEPDGEPPFPTIVSVHGGPEMHHTDMFDRRRAAYADEGFAVLLVNYRGSSGRGREFREALLGNIGFPESEDIVAGLDHVIAEGVADPTKVFLEGWSWGGYLSTLNAGINPDRWRAVCAGIPVGDYVAAHYECAPALRAWDLATLGGSPTDLPDLYHERNPMTYVDRVTAPMLLIAGEHDSRCPIGQVITYYVTLKARGHDVRLHTYASGHHANDVEEQIRHVELAVEFFRSYL